MARPSLQNIMSVKDPLLSWNWEITIPIIPGVSDTREFTLRAMSSSIPGTTIEQLSWEAHGKKRHFAGRRMWDETWECTLIETRDMGTRDMLNSWLKKTRTWGEDGDGSVGGYASEYAVPVELTLYDDKDIGVRGLQIVNAFPTAVGQVTLDQSSGIVSYSLTLSLDLVKDVPAAG